MSAPGEPDAEVRGRQRGARTDPQIKLDFGWLAVLSELRHNANLALVGRVLGRSKGAVWARARQIEQAVGVKLYRRLGSELELTDDGKALAEYGWRVVTEGKALLDHVAHGRKSWLAVGLAVDCGLLRHVAAPAIERFLAVHEGPFRVAERSGDAAVQLVRDREVDVALAVLDAPPVGLMCREVARFPFVAVTRSDHPICDKRGATIADLADDTLILTSTSAARSNGTAALARASTVVASGDLAVTLAEITGGIAIVEAYHPVPARMQAVRLRDVEPAVVRVVHGREMLIDVGWRLPEELLRERRTRSAR